MANNNEIDFDKFLEEKIDKLIQMNPEVCDYYLKELLYISREIISFFNCKILEKVNLALENVTEKLN